MSLSWAPSPILTRNNRDLRALSAVTAPKFGKTETPNNGICTIIASSVCVKVPPCSWLKLLIPIWTLIGYKQPEGGRFISLRTTILAVCALPAPGNGGAGNGTHSTAAQLFRIWKCPYFDFEIYTCIERLRDPLKDNRRRAVEKELLYIVYSCYTGDFGPWARFRHMASQKNWKMRYLFKRLDQQTTTTAHPQWAMGTHRSAPCPHLDGLVTDMDALFFLWIPPSSSS